MRDVIGEGIRGYFGIPNSTMEVLYLGSFHCKLNTSFCVTGYYKEKDLMTEDDVLDRLPFYCSKRNPFHVIHHINFTGGDGFGEWDNYYEPFLELVHNCTCDNTARRIIHYFPLVKFRFLPPEELKLKYQEFDIHMTNNGTTHEFINPSKDEYSQELRDWIVSSKPIHTDEKMTEKNAASHLRADF
ncbi:hypothetical protein GCK72_022976 [Caenorhabditis remanei]|uniref:Uncharacterized protein n=1 Tax=Caenorhabditis remanei TaxID=31234 RepID=A0A6A5FV63_CAERE|nr:hypothetical protein GCK72_022976 [Caenorhabditis remanei]KAF1746520.1 hypothetical protein GCK72_022976 [Caenorhabditis remanei]